jgi:hypothetical protein
VKRCGTLAALLLAAACGSPARPAPTLSASVLAVDPAAVTAALARDDVFHDRFGRRTLYTWTTVDQVTDLARTRRLLTREESPAKGAAYGDQVLFALAQRGDDIARLLYSAGFAKARHAWPAPWATRAGWPGESYGDRLIQLVLRPDAIIVGVSTAVGVFAAQTAGGADVPFAEVRAHPERIAAIYFVSDATRSPAPTVPRPTATFREYVVCNESMIETWAVGTPAIAHELADEAATLDALVRYLRARTQPTHVAIPGAWAKAALPVDPEAAYAAALAFDSPHYRLDPDALALLEQDLRAVPHPVAVEGTGAKTFAVGPARQPPRVVPATPSSTLATYAKPPTP